MPGVIPLVSGAKKPSKKTVFTVLGAIGAGILGLVWATNKGKKR